MSRATSYGTQGLPRSFADGRLRRSGCIYARMQPIPKLTVQVVRIGLAAGGMRVDLMIAATAIAAELPLYTTNPGDFAGLDHLVTVMPVISVGSSE